MIRDLATLIKRGQARLDDLNRALAERAMPDERRARVNELDGAGGAGSPGARSPVKPDRVKKI